MTDELFIQIINDIINCSTLLDVEQYDAISLLSCVYKNFYNKHRNYIENLKNQLH